MENVIDILISQVQETINQAIEDGGESMERTLLLNKGGLNLLANLKQNGYVISEGQASDQVVTTTATELHAEVIKEIDASL